MFPLNILRNQQHKFQTPENYISPIYITIYSPWSWMVYNTRFHSKGRLKKYLDSENKHPQNTFSLL